MANLAADLAAASLEREKMSGVETEEESADSAVTTPTTPTGPPLDAANSNIPSVAKKNVIMDQAAVGGHRLSEEDWNSLSSKQRKRRNQMSKAALVASTDGVADGGGGKAGGSGTGGKRVTKRDRVPYGDTPDSQKGGASKKPKPKPGTTPAVTQAEAGVDLDLKLAVVNEFGGKVNKITPDQATRILKYIEDATDKELGRTVRDGEPKVQPQVLRSGLSQGSLLITVADESTRDWLERKLHTSQQLWAGCKLKLVKQRELSQLTRLRLWMQGRFVPRDKLLARIAGLNNLAADQWEILSHEMDNRGTSFVLGLRPLELAALEAKNFEVFVSTGCFKLVSIDAKKQSGGSN